MFKITSPVIRAGLVIAGSLTLIGAGAVNVLNGSPKSSRVFERTSSVGSTGFPTKLVGWQHSTTTTTAPPVAVSAVPAPSPHSKPSSGLSKPPKGRSGPPSGGFAACVRGKESTNNYGYSGYYHGAYNMTLDHWGGYGGYARPEDAPPTVQDAKFQSDVAQGPAYMHQQYPRSSRECGM